VAEGWPGRRGEDVQENGQEGKGREGKMVARTGGVIFRIIEWG